MAASASSVNIGSADPSNGTMSVMTFLCMLCHALPVTHSPEPTVCLTPTPHVLPTPAPTVHPTSHHTTPKRRNSRPGGHVFYRPRFSGHRGGRR